MARNFQLARESHVALHRQLAQYLRAAILRGEYKVDGQIPTEPQLIERFGVSRITARQAVDALVREGLVSRQQGKGTFVTGPVVHHDLLDLRGIYDTLVAQGLRPQTQLLELGRTSPPSYVAARLARPRRKPLHWRRLFMLHGKPIALGEAYVNVGAARITEEQVRAHSTYSLLENLLGETIARADLSIRYAPALPALARTLERPTGTPLMVLERVSYNAAGVPLEHTLYSARAELYEFSLTVRGKLPITRSLRTAASK
jgi:GntR family transcriptional regulator